MLRLGPGDEFSVTDGAGAEYQVRVEHLGRDRGRALVLARTEPLRESALELVLAQALPKGDRFSFVLEKAAELGVRGIMPLISQRTVAAGGAGAAAAARWRRIIESAVAQSGRTRLPVLRPLCSFEEMIADPSPPELRILLWEHATDGSARGDRPAAPRRAPCSWRSVPRAAGRSRRCSGRGRRDSPSFALAPAS